MKQIFVAQKDEMDDDEMRLVEVDNFDIGIYRYQGKYFAYRNQCLHQGGPVCDGMTIARVHDVIAPDRTFVGQRFDESEPHIVCPWHAWEYNLLTGECAGDRRMRLKGTSNNNVFTARW